VIYAFLATAFYVARFLQGKWKERSLIEFDEVEEEVIPSEETAL
jgi:DNA-directed RNA polymerase delta subunit